MNPEASIEHKLPKRTRLRVPSKRGNPAYFQAVADGLSKVSGVVSVRTNPACASVVVEHAAHGIERISADAARNGLFELSPVSTRPETTRRFLVPARQPTEAQSLSTLALAFGGLSIYQATGPRHLGTATENLWNAYGAQRALNNPLLAAFLAIVGLAQLTRGEVLGSATSLLYYALSARHLARTGNPAPLD